MDTVDVHLFFLGRFSPSILITAPQKVWLLNFWAQKTTKEKKEKKDQIAAEISSGN